MFLNNKHFVLFSILLSTIKSSDSKGSPSRICDTRSNKILQCDSQVFGQILTCLPGVETPSNFRKCDTTQPYCNIGRYEDYCSDVQETSSVHCYQIGMFSCSKPGFYPNVMNCQSYFYCNGDTQTVLPTFCPLGYYFNAKTFKCDRLLRKGQCYVPTCTERGLFQYKTNSQLFYSCTESTSALLIPRIQRCDAREVFRNNECTFLCWISGRFVHEDPTRYYECYRSGPRFAYVIRSCGTKRFNPVLKRCDY